MLYQSIAMKQLSVVFKLIKVFSTDDDHDDDDDDVNYDDDNNSDTDDDDSNVYIYISNQWTRVLLSVKNMYVSSIKHQICHTTYQLPSLYNNMTDIYVYNIYYT